MRRNWLEWLVLAASVVAIAAVAALLVVEGVQSRRPPDPRVTVRAEEGREGNHGWIVPATVRNQGDDAAEAVGWRRPRRSTATTR